MINIYTYKKLKWIDLESPTKDEIRSIMEEYRIHPLIADELINPSLKQKVDLYKDFIYLILHFPALKHSHQKTAGANQEIDFVIGKDVIITSHYDTVDPLHEFAKIFEVNSILDKSHIGDHAGFIFYHMMKSIYRASTNELEAIEDSLKEIETQIFAGEERAMVFALSKISRNLLNFKTTISLHNDILQSFEAAGKIFFAGEFEHYLQAISSEYFKVDKIIKSHIEALAELRETNNSLLSTKQNEIMTTLTVMAFIILPLSFISSLYSMNTSFWPFVGVKNDFWIISGTMAIIGIIIFLAFKRKRWL
ncbi:MAG: CorA family divalent cation transporter [Candidatus Paceibacterota bacterium]|jgi:magnesium transporter